jgi:hypothetical protein
MCGEHGVYYRILQNRSIKIILEAIGHHLPPIPTSPLLAGEGLGVRSNQVLLSRLSIARANFQLWNFFEQNVSSIVLAAK